MNQSEKLPPKIYKSNGIAWGIAILFLLLAGVLWWIASEHIILCALISVALLLFVYDAYKKRNDCITLNEEGISLDRVTLLHNSKKYAHIDIKWKNIRHVEILYFSRKYSIYIHTKEYNSLTQKTMQYIITT